MESGLYKKYIGSPCKKNGIDPKAKKAYQDSVQNLHKSAYDEYVKRSKKGFETSDDGGYTMIQVPPREPKDIKSLKEFAYTIEIGKGGSVTKDGKTASQLARENK